MTDDLAKFIDDLVERTARRTVELLAEAREEQRVDEARLRARASLADTMAAALRHMREDVAAALDSKRTNEADWPAGVEVE
jgi:non-ribosomal peptide synthetase component F